MDFIRQLDKELPSGTIAFIGPQQDISDELRKIRRVRLLGKKPLTSLPHYASAAHGLIMPYADIPVTREMQPLKLKEYLATMKPVIVRKLPSTVEWSDCLDMAVSARGFSTLAYERSHTGLLDEQRIARQRLLHESWKAKSDLFYQYLFD